LFNFLSEVPDSMTVQELVVKTGAAPELLARILRYLASIAMIKETGKDSFAATNVTKALAKPGFQGGIHHYFDSFGPALQEFPDFLKETEYANIQDNTKTPLQKAWNTPDPAFIWVQTRPENLAYFNQWMAAQREGMPVWLDVFPIEAEVKTLNSKQSSPLFVDIGGGLGHQAIAFKEKFPNLAGRVILQDIPATLEHAISHPGVEVMVQDFFNPQAIQGAKFYYMRNILHDYPDEKCKIIIQNTIQAMNKDSILLIDEMVLPNSGVHWQAAQLDLAMMIGLASQERTEEQWYALLETSGLKISKIYTYTSSLKDSIIAAVLA